MKQTLFYVHKNGAELGPFEHATIERMLAAGMVKQDDFFREENEQAWRPLFMWTEAKPNHLVAFAPTPMVETHSAESRGTAKWLPWICLVAFIAIVVGIGFFKFQGVKLTGLPLTKAPDSVDGGEQHESTDKPSESTQGPASGTVGETPNSGAVVLPAAGTAPSQASAVTAEASAQEPKPEWPRSNPGQQYRPKAEQGDAVHQALLADALIIEGWTSDQFKEGADWAEKSAAQGCPLGKAVLAHAIHYGVGRSSDRDLGVELSRDNAIAILAEAETNLPAWQRWAATAPPRSFRTYPEAFEKKEDVDSRRHRLLRQAAKAGDFQAAVLIAEDLGRWSPAAKGEQSDLIGWLQKAADANFLPAIHELARLNQQGVGTEQNDTRAETLWKKAADQGWGWSALELAMVSYEKAPDSKDFSRLLNADQLGSNPSFGLEMFQRFVSGIGLPKDESAAEKWLLKLPPGDQATAIANHIHRLLLPKEGESQFEQAEKWFSRLTQMQGIPQKALRELSSVALGLDLGDTLGHPPRPKAPEEAFKWLMRAAKLGGLDAMNSLGRKYSAGEPAERNKVAAGQWYQKAADTGDPGSIWSLARFLAEEGESASAAQLFRRLISGDEGRAITDIATKDLADLLAKGGEGLPKDDVEATNLYRQSAARCRTGSFQTTALLCWRLRKGLGVPAKPDEVAEWERKLEQSLKAKTKQERGWALNSTAEIFQKAPSLDKEEENRWWLRSADEGDSRGLGVVAFGAGQKGGTGTEAKAVESLRQLAESGDQYAMYSLGRRYSEGKGLKKDEKEASRWIEKAAEKGHYLALFDIGCRYVDGDGVSKDTATGIKWLKKSAAGNDPFAIFKLALMYKNGTGVEKDTAEAVRWYEKGGFCGDASSMLNLGAMYANGDSVPKDYVKAYAWTNVAAARATDEETRKKTLTNRRLIEQNATRSQIAEGQALSRVIVAKIESYLAKLSKSSQQESEPAPAQSTRTGTAWAVTSNGHLVTSAHVVAGASAIHVTTDSGEKLRATLVKTDTKSDLALLKIEGQTSPLFLEPSAEVGQRVATLGFPNTQIQGLEPKLTDGTVSSLSGLNDDRTTLQISVPIQPGNSGGPLVNMNGGVVGIINSRLSDAEGLRQSGALPQAVNFATKSQAVHFLLSDTSGLQKARVADQPLDLPELARLIRGCVYFVEAASSQ